jgi:hypothetical protein
MTSRVDGGAETGVHRGRVVRVLTVIAVVLLTLRVVAELMDVPEPDAGKWSPRSRAAAYEPALANFVESHGETTAVVDRDGRTVGFITAADMLGDIFESPWEIAARGGAPATDRLPVWSYADGSLVGYMIFDVGFRSLAELDDR